MSEKGKDTEHQLQNKYLTEAETQEAHQIAKSRSVQEILQGMIDLLQGIEYDIVRLDKKMDNELFSEIWGKLRKSQTYLAAWRAKTLSEALL